MTDEYPVENLKRGREEGATRTKLPCPGCGEKYANLPQHMRACDDVEANHELDGWNDGGYNHKRR